MAGFSRSDPRMPTVRIDRRRLGLVCALDGGGRLLLARCGFALNRPGRIQGVVQRCVPCGTRCWVNEATSSTYQLGGSGKSLSKWLWRKAPPLYACASRSLGERSNQQAMTSKACRVLLDCVSIGTTLTRFDLWQFNAKAAAEVLQQMLTPLARQHHDRHLPQNREGALLQSARQPHRNDIKFLVQYPECFEAIGVDGVGRCKLGRYETAQEWKSCH